MEEANARLKRAVLADPNVDNVARLYNSQRRIGEQQDLFQKIWGIQDVYDEIYGYFGLGEENEDINDNGSMKWYPNKGMLYLDVGFPDYRSFTKSELKNKESIPDIGNHENCFLCRKK